MGKSGFLGRRVARVGDLALYFVAHVCVHVITSYTQVNTQGSKVLSPPIPKADQHTDPTHTEASQQTAAVCPAASQVPGHLINYTCQMLPGKGTFYTHPIG